MGIIFIVLLAIGLAMDCFAISIACGASKQTFKAHQGVVMALTFGLFQGIMPLIGWLCGFYFTERIIPIVTGRILLRTLSRVFAPLYL